MRQTITLVAFCLGLILFNSCGAPKDIAYFQNEGQLTQEAMEKMKNYLDPTIKEGDELKTLAFKIVLCFHLALGGINGNQHYGERVIFNCQVI